MFKIDAFFATTNDLFKQSWASFGVFWRVDLFSGDSVSYGIA